eukprot:scaffold10870_cov117-Isochrysis_galbana.AAC.4
MTTCSAPARAEHRPTNERSRAQERRQDPARQAAAARTARSHSHSFAAGEGGEHALLRRHRGTDNAPVHPGHRAGAPARHMPQTTNVDVESCVIWSNSAEQ